MNQSSGIKKFCFLSLTALTFALSCFVATALAADPGPVAARIKIGISVPLTGEAAFQGEDVKNAIIVANEQLAHNAYDLVIEDDKCNGKEATSVAQKLASVDKVQYVLGFPCSGALLPASAVYERAKIVTISSVAMASAVSDSGDYIFRTCPNNSQMAKALFGFVANHYKKIGIISEETEYPQSLAREFNKLAATASVQVVSESYLPETTDFRTVLLRLKNSGIEALFVNPQAEPAFVRILEQMSELNWKPQVLGNLYPSSPTFLKLAGNLAAGLIFSDLPFVEGTLTAEGQKLYNQFLSRFGQPVSSDFSVVTSFAAFASLHEAIQSGHDVKDYLYHHKFSRVARPYSFDAHGDIVGIEPAMKQIKNGNPVGLRRDSSS